MYYIIYRTTNKINNKFYVGYHKTKNLEDDYLGSGKLILKAIEKYGKENFEKKILYIFSNVNEALLKEIEIVNEDFVKRKDTYNIKIGGEGGWKYINELKKNDKKFNDSIYNKVSSSMRKLYKEENLGWKNSNKNRKKKNKNQKEKTYGKGRKLSEEHKKHISFNNGMKLSFKEIEKRLKNYKEIEKNRGWITILSKKWNVSHTQVRRFINKHSDSL